MKKILILLSVISLVTSCKKKTTEAKTEPETVATTQPAGYTVYATFTVENQNGYLYTHGNFPLPTNPGANRDGGVLSINGYTTDYNNSYYTYYSTTPTTLTPPISFTVGGGNVYAFPFTATCVNIPDLAISPDLDTSKTVYASSGYTITHQPIVCDSLEYQMTYLKVKKTKGNNTSIVFTSAELQNLSYGIAVGGGKVINVKIIAYTHDSHEFDINHSKWTFLCRSVNLQSLHYVP